jgi:hypothetical protein
MRKIICGFVLSAIAILAVACGSETGESKASQKLIKNTSIGNGLTVSISSSDGVIHVGDQVLTLAFTDSAGTPIEVGAVSLNLRMPAMGSMSEMNSGAALTTTKTPGVYSAKVKVDMAGEWQALIAFDGPAGKGTANIPVTAR